jgi:hypothetical protein
MKKVSIKFGQSKAKTIVIAKGVKKLSTTKTDDKGNYLQAIDKNGEKVWEIAPTKEKLIEKFYTLTESIELDETNITLSIFNLMTEITNAVKYAMVNEGKFYANDGRNIFNVKANFELSVILDGKELKLSNISTILGALTDFQSFRKVEKLCINIVSILTYELENGRLLDSKITTFKTLA